MEILYFFIGSGDTFREMKEKITSKILIKTGLEVIRAGREYSEKARLEASGTASNWEPSVYSRCWVLVSDSSGKLGTGNFKI